MRIGLFGFNFENANKGCEALTYAFLNLLEESGIDRSDEIIYFSNDELMGEIESSFPNLKVRLVRIKLKDIKMQFIKEIKKCDIAFDITYGDNFSDIYLPKFAFKTTMIKNIAISLGVPLVLLPQTYGPFNGKILRQMAKRAINRSLKVYSRDELSIDCIKGMSNREVVLTTDLAFLLPYKSTMPASNKFSLGVNVSGLLWKGGYNSDNQFGLTVDYQEYIENLISHYEDTYEIHLIPHVIETVPHSLDGDLWIVDELCKKHPKCIQAPAFSNAMEAKSYISNMDIFVGARMHSTVAAFSSTVAVIPFSYSRKFEGLYNNLGYPYVVHGCSDSTQEAIDKTIDWINDYKILHNKVLECQLPMNKQLSEFTAQLLELIKIYK